MNIQFKKNHTYTRGNVDYFILLNGKEVGTMKVTRFGWKQFQRVRGRDASQTWQVDVDGKLAAFFDYLKDAKQYAVATLGDSNA